MKKLLIALGIVIIIVVILVIVKKGSNDNDAENFVIGQADVTSVTTDLQESFPVGVSVSVSGDLPDSCTQLGNVIQNKDTNSNDFTITLETKRPLGAQCAQVLSSFDTSFTLNGTDGLMQGEYGVIVNGVRTTFTFDVDNYISDLDPLK